MSITSTWVLAEDGRYYEDPTLYDPDHFPPWWFLCFDEDEPPELVVRVGTPIPDLPYFERTTPVRKARKGCRIFDHNPDYKAKVEPHAPAHAYFGKLTQPIPVPTRWREKRGCSEIGQTPNVPCTYCTPKWPAHLPDPRPQRRRQ